MPRSHRWKSNGLLVCLVVALANLIGCDRGPTTYPVRGKVIIKGSTATLAGGTVMFQSVANPEVQASGTIENDGTFELFSNQEKSGMLAGEHRVMIQPPSLEAGQPKVIADKYRNYDTSGLTQTIQEGDNNLLIEVEPPKSR